MVFTPSSILLMLDTIPWISMVIPSIEKKRMMTMRNTKAYSMIFFAVFQSPPPPAATDGDAFFLAFFLS